MTLHFTAREAGHHLFSASPNPRNQGCVRCGKPADAHVSPSERDELLSSPIVRAASAVGDLQLAAKYAREANWFQARELAARAVRAIDRLAGEG